MKRPLRWAMVAVAGTLTTCLLCVSGTTLMLLNESTDNSASAGGGAAAGCGDSRAVDPDGELPGVPELTPDQVHNAAIIVHVGQEMNVPPRGWVIGVATALQESRLTNLPNLGARNDHDSIGLFQQRPSQGWGTPEQLADPAYQARRFFEKLLRINGWATMPLTDAAQRVQISAYPDAYAKHEPLASRVVDVLTGGGSRAAGSDPALRCVATGEIAASGWTVPVNGPIVSRFRPADRPTHNGVDIAVARGTPVHAAAAGVVLTAKCNAHVGGQPYSCDRDGGISVAGCGWYVDILHANSIITRYCHMVRRPDVVPGQRVAPGQVIGASGSSGHSSGPHVHFEVHVDSDPSPAGAIDPLPFMAQAGAPLVPL
jgi:murein DD-endopeptidase MepM/ murein hydrolase activator NlpD